MPEDGEGTIAREFLMMAQSGIGAMDFSNRGDPASAAGALMFLAIAASKQIPEGHTAFGAFLDFCNYRLSDCIDEAPAWLDPKIEIDTDDVEVCIDGIWQSERPRWRDLPFDDSTTLEALALLRERQSMRMQDFIDALPGVNRHAIRQRLQRASVDGFCELIHKGREWLWLARGPIEKAGVFRPDPSNSKKKSRLREVDVLRARERQSLLRRIGKPGGAAMKDLLPLLPRGRTHIVRALNALAQQGEIKLTGKGRGARWHLTSG